MKKMTIELSKVERKQNELEVLSRMFRQLDEQIGYAKESVLQYSTEFEEMPQDVEKWRKKDAQLNYLNEHCSYDYMLKIKDMLEKLI